jgi:hypothetical protein
VKDERRRRRIGNVKGKTTSVFPRPMNPKKRGRTCMRRRREKGRLEADSARALESIPRVPASSQVPLRALYDIELVGRVEAEKEREAADDDVERGGRPDPGVVEGVDDVERSVAAGGSGDDGFEAAVGGGGCKEGRTRKVSLLLCSRHCESSARLTSLVGAVEVGEHGLEGRSEARDVILTEESRVRTRA